MNDSIPLAGVIGQPVAHSRSPALHGHWLARYGIAGHYVPLHVTQADLAAVLHALPRMGFRGVNVTLPHKEAVLALADVVTDRAALIGAANTLIFRQDGTLHADNTDGYGFVASLRQQVPGWDAGAGPAAVLGAGGAARAVVVSLLDAGAPIIRISNRSRARAEALRHEFGGRIEVHDWVHAADMLESATTVVNATSLGMQGKPPLNISLHRLGSEAVVSDLVYTPLRTEFLNSAAQRGCSVVDGLGMLLHQAVPGFERWFGQRPAVDAAARSAALG